MLDHDQANDRAWDRLLEHLDTDVATVDDFEHFDATPPAPLPEAKVAAIVARATGNHRRNRRTVAGVALAATLMIAVLIAGVTSHSSPTAPVGTDTSTPYSPSSRFSKSVSLDTLTPAEAFGILRDHNRVRIEYEAAIARATLVARDSIGCLQTWSRDPKTASDAAAHAKARLEALAPLLTPEREGQGVSAPRRMSLPHIDASRSLSIADIDDVAGLAAYATASVAGFRTGDEGLEVFRKGSLDKIAGYLTR